MYGVVPFYEACIRHEIKPIIGLEITVKEEERNYLLRLYAQNENGYRHLLNVATIIGHIDEKNAFVTIEELSPFLKDVIVIFPYEDGPFFTHLVRRDLKQAFHSWKKWKQYLNDVHVFHEMRANINETSKEMIRSFSKEANVPLIASHPCFFTEKDDYDAYKIAKSIRDGITIEEYVEVDGEATYYLHRPETFEQMFQHDKDAIENATKLSNYCNVTLPLGDVLLPEYKDTDGLSSDEKLRQLCVEGAINRYGKITETVEKRLEKELSVITKMGFSDYFLIVWDVMNYALKRNILTGPGRGSAAGSLVAYVLSITDVDPLAYDLLFERFLNEERISMPDIDLDFPDKRRDEIIHYVYRKYGKEYVAQILTFGTLGARAVIRDVARALGIKQNKITSFINLLPQSSSFSLQKALEQNARLRSLLEESNELKRLWKLALKLEGLPRHVSTHAAGVVISGKPLTSIVALQKGQTAAVSLTQASMTSVEKLGLLKFDFLGLRNLTLLEQMVSLIRQHTGKAIDLYSLPLDDKKTFSLLADGNTSGIFQLESEGMRRVLRKLKPTQFEDIVAVNALFRPGPMEFIQTYIDGKYGRRKVTYAHPDVEPILKKTYGVIVYQEQIMQIATCLSGFTLAEADILRRAISKKDKAELMEKKAAFIEGALRKGYEKRVAEEIFSFIERFADYGFNRSHAVAYSMISYWLAYIKAHFPFIFYSALLSSIWNDRDKLFHYIQECKAYRFDILPPSINNSEALFTIEGEAIRFGLLPISHVGYQAVQEIVRTRKEKRFSSFFDFIVRVDQKKVTRKTIEQLIKVGAMDEFGEDRATLLASIEQYVKMAVEVKQFQQQTDGLFTLQLPHRVDVNVPPFSVAEKLMLEKEVLGFYLTGHPLDNYRSELKQLGMKTIYESLMENERFVRLAGLIVNVRTIRTVTGEKMAFAQFSDETTDVDIVLFPQVWRTVFPLFEGEELFYMEGKTEERNGKKQIVVQKLTTLTTFLKGIEVLFLRITEASEKEETLRQIKETLQSHPGNVPVILYYERTKEKIQLPNTYWVTATKQCIDSIVTTLGEDNVVLKKVRNLFHLANE